MLCIFIFEIDNTASSEDNFLWVIVGDFPPMYLGTHGRNTTIDVLQDYMLLASDWINHVKEAKPVDDCYPFDAVPTIEMAELLEQKITSMKNILIDNIKEIIWER